MADTSLSLSSLLSILTFPVPPTIMSAWLVPMTQSGVGSSLSAVYDVIDRAVMSITRRSGPQRPRKKGVEVKGGGDDDGGDGNDCAGGLLLTSFFLFQN